MRLKSFYGPTMTEAMRCVREALGENAIIVATRDDDGGGVRVTAAIDDPVVAPAEKRPSFAPMDQEGSEAIEGIASALLAHQAPQVLAEKLVATATQFASEDPLLAFGAALDTHFKFTIIADDSAAPRPVIFIGPPGAGKTLCAAKFATKATLAQRPVTVISTDTERAGGMAQLSAFTRLLKSDMLEIEDAPALQDAVSMQKAGALVLIDTAGCNPFNEAERQNLAKLVKASGADPVLVLPADQDAATALEMANAFAALGASKIIFTRLDMTRRVGGLLQTAYESRLPLSHFSATAKVTIPPQPLNPVSLARLVLPKSAEKPEAGKRAV